MLSFSMSTQATVSVALYYHGIARRHQVYWNTDNRVKEDGLDMASIGHINVWPHVYMCKLYPPL